MFIKSFITIFLALFYVGILRSSITTIEEAPFIVKIFVNILVWFIQAIIGANIVIFLYYIWG